MVERGTPVGRHDYIAKADSPGGYSVGYADGFALTAVSRPKNLNDLARHLVKTVLPIWDGVG